MKKQDSRITTSKFALWTKLFKGWLSLQFVSLARQGSNDNATNTAILEAINTLSAKVDELQEAMHSVEVPM